MLTRHNDSWFLDNPDLGWTPPASLLNWITKARADAKPIVYIGFGSITVPNPPAVTRSIVKAVLKSKIPLCVLSDDVVDLPDRIGRPCYF